MTQPEAAYNVTVEGDDLRVIAPDGASRLMDRQELVGVYVGTNDSGPWGSDLWFVLETNDGELTRYPLGATDDREALDWLLKLPGFELKGMGSTGVARFVCWSGWR